MMTEMSTERSGTKPPTTAHPNSNNESVSKPCATCGAPVEVPLVAGSLAFLNRLDVYCDRHEEARIAQAEREAYAVKLRERFSALQGAGLLTPAFRDAGFSRSKKDLEGRNFETWRQARGWNDEQNVLLYGPPGTGKTYLAYCLLRKRFITGASVAEVTARRFCKEADRFDEGRGIYKAWCSAQCLLLDDIDKARWNEDRVDALWELFNTRLSHGRRTILTSNLAPADIQAMLVDAIPATNSSKAVAALERLNPCLKLHLHGESYRQTELVGCQAPEPFEPQKVGRAS